MITFKVDNVQQNKFESRYAKPGFSKQTVSGLIGTGVEASSISEDNYLSTANNLISAVNTAYDGHLPLVLSPDMLWLAISQGLSTHITNNAEQLRHQFVNFEGKKELIVYENEFRKGSPDNNWPHMFGQFSREIAEYIGKKRDLIVNSFSTTGPVELAASEVVLMEAMSKYFDYTCRTMCGIPSITLLGEVEDWQKIVNRVQNISEFDLSWWTKSLEPIAQEFVNAAKGNADKSFWQNMYKESGGSGGPYISGWIVNLFPYLKGRGGNFDQRNTFNVGRGMGHGLTSDTLPIGMAKVPFKWEYFSSVYKMELAAGFTGFKVVDGAVTPQIGWFVRDTELMTPLKMSFKRDPDYNKNNELRNNFLKELSALGFEETGGGWGERINGHVTTPNLSKVKQISGLIFSDEQE
jgi:hypothetical protein